MVSKAQKTEPLKTVLVITLGMLVVYLVFKANWALYTALIIGLAGTFSPYLAKQIDFLWMKLTWLLSMIVPNLLLTAIFFLFLTPIAWLSRIFGEKNPLNLKNPGDSLFKECVRQYDKKSFERPW
jgi:hypothetical protein